MNSKAITFIILSVLLVTSCSGAAASPTPTIKVEPSVTLIPSATSTRTPPPTATSIQPATPTPLSNAVYYMIVLDASAKMNEAFDGGTKWDAAYDSINSILDGLEPGANYGLVVIGGSSATEGMDPCNEPSVVSLPFSSKQKVSDQIGHLQPAGAGSTYSAFALAQNQFDGLPRNTIRTMVFITSSSDSCDSRDEWKDLEEQLKLTLNSEVGFHSEIIILDGNLNADVKGGVDRIGSTFKDINFQLPSDTASLRETNEIVIGNLKNYIDHEIATRPTETPILSPYTLTPKPVTPTFTSTITDTPAPPTIMLTWTSTATPSFTPTASPAFVKLLSVNYLTRGVGCQIDVQVQVTGSEATGHFHVRNPSMDAAGEEFPQITLQVGTNWISTFSVSNLPVLRGDHPEYYLHEIWFDYNGVQTNHLTDLICPGLILPS